MTSFTYNPAIPNGPNSPSADQPIMKQNAASINSIIAVDHIGFNTNNGGWHTIIHQPVQGSAPAVTPGITQLYSLNYTPNSTVTSTGTQLFMTNSGGTIQMTGTSQQTDGWAWFNGMLYQWGRITGKSGAWPTTDQTLTFKDRVAGAIPFSNNCFAVTTTFIGPSSSSTGDICINSVSATNFHWQFTGSSSASFDGFYWMAIGN